MGPSDTRLLVSSHALYNGMGAVMTGRTAFGAANLGSVVHKTAASVSTDCTLYKRSLRWQVLPWLMLTRSIGPGPKFRTSSLTKQKASL